MDHTVQLSTGIFHVPYSGDELCCSGLAAVKIVCHVIQVMLLLGLQLFPNCIFVSDTVSVIHLIPITIFLIGHLEFEGAVIIRCHSDKFLGHRPDTVHQFLRRSVLFV